MWPRQCTCTAWPATLPATCSRKTQSWQLTYWTISLRLSGTVDSKWTVDFFTCRNRLDRLSQNSDTLRPSRPMRFFNSLGRDCRDGLGKLLWLDAAQEDLHCGGHSFGKAVGAGNISGPFPHQYLIQPIHDLRQMEKRKVAGNLTSLLPLSQDSLEHGDHLFVPLPHLGGNYGIHGATEHHRPP